MITQELLKEYFYYKDGSLYAAKSRTGLGIHKKAGSKRTNGYIYLNFHKKIYLAHRLIFLYHHGYLPKILDHIDGNPLNNRIENLRPATYAQNLANMKTPKSNKSGVKGVCFDKSKNKWVAEIKCNGVKHRLGRFDTLEEATKKIREKRNQLHKEFARHE